MKEAFADLWKIPAAIRVITTNGSIKKDGSAVMGKGCALEAKAKFGGIDVHLGRLLRENGNVVNVLFEVDPDAVPWSLWTFPVKHGWRDRADLELIARSAVQLIELADLRSYARRIVLPRPGCGNGGRDWAREVKPLLANLLDDRFTVAHLGPIE